MQILRTERYSRQLKEGSTLPLMAVVVATIAAMSLLLTASEHVPLVLTWLQHPDQLQASLSWPTLGQALPVVWSAVMSTDLVLLIEVRSPEVVSCLSILLPFSLIRDDVHKILLLILLRDVHSLTCVDGQGVGSHVKFMKSLYI